MAGFNEEMHLLVRNWDRVMDIEAAIADLDAELLSILMDVRDVIESRDWYQAGWVVDLSGLPSRLTVIRSGWKAQRSPAIGLGILEFTARNVFGRGAEKAPWLLMQASGFDPKGFARWLGQRMDDDGLASLGRRDNSPSNAFVVSLALQKCSADDLDLLPQTAAQGILGFFDHYADVIGRLDDGIRQYVAE